MRIRIVSQDQQLLLGVVAGLFLSLDIPAATATPEENPYARTIVGRNAFSLNKKVHARTEDSPPTQPPRIVLQGVTNTLPRRQVLFKVQVPARPGMPAQVMSCVLSEGERLGEIEVLGIDVRAGTIKFNNHGFVQTLSMADDAESVLAVPTRQK